MSTKSSGLTYMYRNERQVERLLSGQSGANSSFLFAVTCLTNGKHCQQPPADHFEISQDLHQLSRLLETDVKPTLTCPLLARRVYTRLQVEWSESLHRARVRLALSVGVEV